MSEGYDEADIRKGLRDGGKVLQAFIVMRPTNPGDGPLDAEYVGYIRTSWRRGYRILQVFRHKRDKTYMGSGLSRLIWLLRKEFNYEGALVLHQAGCEQLQRFAGLRRVDYGRPSEEEDGPPRAASAKPPWEWPVRYPPRETDNKPAGTEEEE